MIEVSSARKLVGLEGDYQAVYEIQPKEEHKELFAHLVLGYDVGGKHGFVLLISHDNFRVLKQLELTVNRGSIVPDLVFVERFKVQASRKKRQNLDTEFEYFVVLRIKIPRGLTVKAEDAKREIER